MADKDPYTVDRQDLRQRIEKVLDDAGAVSHLMPLDDLMNLVMQAINGEHGTVTLTCDGNCEPGNAYHLEPPAPQEDCPVHGRSYADVWRLAGDYQQDLTRVRLDAEQEETALDALRTLVGLKDGPRDEAYEMAKPAAWAQARRVIAERGSGPDTTRLIEAEGEERRLLGVLFNDITFAPISGFGLLFSNRMRLANHLWKQGWRREISDEDVTRRG